MTTLSSFRRATNCKSFPAGRSLFREGEPGEGIDTVGPGEILGESAPVSREQFLCLARRAPRSGPRVAQMTVTRLDRCLDMAA
jgi:CRP-like cAMP-binding protein